MKVDNPEKLVRQIHMNAACMPNIIGIGLIFASSLQHSMEVLSPQLAEEDQELWLEFIKRDIPQWETYDIPEKTNHWYEVYCDLREMVQRSVDADAEQMKRSIDGIQSERAKLTPKLITGKSVPGMRRSRNNPRSGLPISAQRKANNIFAPQKRNTAMAKPTHSLNAKASQVRQAPLSLVMAHQLPAKPSVSKRNDGIRVPIVPGRSRVQESSSSSASPHPVPDNGSPSMAEREARLKSIASGKPLPAQNAGEERKAQAPAKEASSPVKKPILKRQATSPPSHPSPTSSAYYQNQSQSSNVDRTSPPPPETAAPNNAPPRPPMLRKRPPADPFIRPKQRKRIF